MFDIILVWIFLGLAAFLIDGINNFMVLKCKEIRLKNINAFRNAAIETMDSLPKTLKMLMSCLLGGPVALALTLITCQLLGLTLLEACTLKRK